MTKVQSDKKYRKLDCEDSFMINKHARKDNK